MAQRERFLLVVLFLTGILTRLPFIEKMQSHWDAPQYSIGIVRFSLENHTPAPPGYPLYIFLGRVMYLFVHDSHLAIILVSVLFSGVGAVVFYFVGKILFNRTVGIISSLFFLSAPTLYFFGITANPYGALSVTAAILAGIVYLILFKKKNYGFFLGLSLAFAIGFRPQDAFFLPPLFLLGILFLKLNERYKAFVTFFLLSFLWFIPTAFLVGGVSAYAFSLISFFMTGSSLDPSLTHVFSVWFILLKGFYLTLGLAGIFLLYYLKYFWGLLKENKTIFTSSQMLKIFFFFLWIAPSFFFNAFIRSDHAAHQMAYLSALIFLSAYAIWCVTRKHKRTFFLCVGLIVCFNIYTFFRDRDPQNKMPYVSQSYHYSELKKNDVRLDAIVMYIKKNFISKHTIIIVDPEIFRPVTYYLDTFNIYAFSALDTSSTSPINTVHFGKNWNYLLSTDTSRKLFIPNDINYVVVINNNKVYSIRATSMKAIRLKGNATLYSFSTKPGNKYDLSLHAIKQVEPRNK